MKKKAIITALVIFLSIGIKTFSDETRSIPSNQNAILNLNNTAFAYGSIPSILYKFKLGTPSSAIVIGSTQIYDFDAGDWAKPEGYWSFYVLRSLGQTIIFKVDTATGIVTNLGNVTGLLSGHILTFMEWDHTTNIFFIGSTNISSSQFYTLNWSDKSLQPIGSPTLLCAGAVAGGFNRTGNLYVFDNVTNNIYKINKTNGLATLVGPVGFDVNLYTEGAFDRSDWKYYLNSGTRLYQYDSVMSGGTLIGTASIGIRAMCIVSFPVTSINQISSEIPDEYLLYQNYPNPFNPSTNIKFKIKDKGFVSLTVYNTLGKEVETLVNEKLQPGEYKVNFDGSNFNSGIYFYRIITGNYSETKKMILIK